MLQISFVVIEEGWRSLITIPKRRNQKDEGWNIERMGIMKNTRGRTTGKE
jgi:hypothetical protein